MTIIKPECFNQLTATSLNNSWHSNPYCDDVYFNIFLVDESESEDDSSEDEKKRKKPKKSSKKKKRKTHHKSKKRLVIYNCVRIAVYSSHVGPNFLARVMYFTKLGLKIAQSRSSLFDFTCHFGPKIVALMYLFKMSTSRMNFQGPCLWQ